MTRWNPQANQLFLQVLELGSPAARQEFLDEVCAGEAALRAEVESLLEASARAGSFLESPAAAGRSASLKEPILECPGTAIGPYKLLEQIGEGGFGVVFLAEQQRPVRRKVALKILKPGMDTRQVVARFEAERQALAIMDHPNIAKVFDGGATRSGRPYFVMELVRGAPITAFCDQNHLTPRQRLELFVSVCQAVQHAHQKGIIHRDLKPSNVLVALYDGQPVPKVIDFGIAKAAGQPLTDKTLVTGFGALVGTLEYMAPEQTEINQLDIDTRSDLYSLGVLLYELLVGSPPFTRKDVEKSGDILELLRRVREQEPTKPSTKLSTAEGLPTLAVNRSTEPAKLTRLVRGELDWIAMKALEKDRKRRYETANGFALDVQRYLSDEPVQACPPSAVYRFRKFARRNKAALAMIAVLAGALVMAVVGLSVSNWLVTRERDVKVQALSDKEQALARESTALAFAREQEGQAKERAEDAKKQQTRAKAQELLARRRFYASQMHLAMQAGEAGNWIRVLALLESQRPKVDEDDLRSFEWYYLWRLCQGGLRHRFPSVNHDNSAVLALSPDGLSLVSGFENSIKLWDTRSGQEKGTLTGHRTMVEQVEITSDGRTLISSDNVTIRTWDLATGKQRTVLTPGFTRIGNRFAVTADGNTLVLGGAKITLWDLSQGKQVGVVASEANGPYVNPAIAADGRAVAAKCGFDIGKVWVKEGDSWQERHSIPGHGWYFMAAFSPDGKSLAASGGLQVKCYDVATGRMRFALEGHLNTYAVRYSADGKALITAARDKTARVWDAATGRQIVCFAHPLAVHGAALSADGTVAATASGGICVWDTTPPQESFVLRHTARVGGVAISSDGKTLASAGEGETKLWHLDGVTGQNLRLPSEPPVFLSIPGPREASGRGACLALSGDGKTLAVPEPSGGNIALWSAAGKKLAVLEGHATPVTRLAMSPDGKSLASVSPSPQAILWDLPTRKPRAKIQILGQLSAVAFSPDGKTLAVGSQFGAAKLFESATGREIATLLRYELATEWTEALVFSPDGKLIAVGSREGLVQVWEIATGRLHATLRGHNIWGCCSLAFSPDGRTLATGGAGALVKLWDVATGQERCTLKGHQDTIRTLAFAPDGNTLITGCEDGTVRLWPAAVDADARAPKAEVEMDIPDSPAALNEQGDNLWQYGRTEEAERAYAQAQDRLEKLAVTFLGSPRFQQEIIRTLLSRSLLLEHTGRPQEAVPLRERARQLYRNLSANDQQALIWGFRERGRKLSTMHNKQQAERTYSQALELTRHGSVPSREVR